MPPFGSASRSYTRPKGWPSSARAMERAGLELTHEHQPDLVVSDLYRVGFSGIDIFERLRADPRTGHIPFMFITADARAAVRE